MTTRTRLGTLTDANGVDCFVERVYSQVGGERFVLWLDNGELGALTFDLTPEIVRSLAYMIHGQEPPPKVRVRRIK